MLLVFAASLGIAEPLRYALDPALGDATVFLVTLAGLLLALPGLFARATSAPSGPWPPA